MSTQLDPERAAHDARQLLDERVDVVRRLATAAADAERAREAAEQADRDFAGSYREATQAGWTEAELRKIGVPSPKRRGPGRPRKQPAKAGTAQPDQGDNQNQ